ncbi:50S ribosomal protein L13 [Candidatus Cyanaurora vandensis]|uniref:50S ribosomal protein L13 n=1 Tax=Candidatus Cyanaurora vandensis TaxID=2714958 RepID=UPI00257E378C|nr:50S ribosomal protein L13 [Candidatus Cyanaurora vandensis]
MAAVEKTILPTPETLDRRWHIVDATGVHLGRLATAVANLLRGKHKPNFVPFQDTGDFVIVINAEKITVTGKKAEQKLYRRNSGRPGGMKVETYTNLQKRIPERIIEKAIGGMLPHTRLGRQQYTKLKVYKGPNHPHEAQQPSVFTVGEKL